MIRYSVVRALRSKMQASVECRYWATVGEYRPADGRAFIGGGKPVD